MKKVLTTFVLAVWILFIFIFASYAQNHFLPIEVVKVKDINKTYLAGEYGAIELSRLEISEASDDPIAGNVGLLPKKSFLRGPTDAFLLSVGKLTFHKMQYQAGKGQALQHTHYGVDFRCLKMIL
jgi:hypothetical protein